MSSGPRRQTSSNKTVLIILALVGGVGLVLVLICGGLAFWLFRSIASELPAAQASANAFLVDLQANRLDVAYASTTRGFRSNLSLEQFRGFVNAFPALTTHKSRSLQLGNIYQGTGGHQASFGAALQAPTGAMSCTLTLITEDGQWKVHHLSVP
jgi:hypothetical protein